MPEPTTPPVALHVLDAGAGTPVLLVHGLGGDHTVWNELVPPLSAGHRVLVPDLRGHGQSAAPPGSTFSFAELEGDLGRLLDASNTGPVHVVGLSAGGFLALRWALDAPERFRSLVLVNAAPHCDNHTKAVVDRWAETYSTEGFDAYVLRLVKDLYYPDWVDAHLDIVDKLAEQLRRQDLKSVLAWAASVRSFDLRGRLMKVRAPTRILQSMDDSVVDGSHGRLLRVSIPGADLKLFTRTGHLLPIEQPAETAAAIREFVDAVDGRSPAGPA